MPVCHPDTLAFLRALKNKYKPNLVISLGDEIDGNAFSFHEKDPDLLSPGAELELAIKRLKPLYEMFPEMHLVESNHGSLVYRRGRAFGLPRHVFKGYREVIEAPRGWRWSKELIVNGDTYICHGLSSDGLKLSQSLAMNVVQGHYHEKFEIKYWHSKMSLKWAASAGCLIDDDSLAFSYNKLNLKKPLIGTVVVIDGHPILEPLLMDKDGRWTQKLVGS